MNNEENIRMTELDYLTASPRLQMIKAALPYIHIQEQRFFSLLVKIGELERTVRLFEPKEEGELGICSLEGDAPASPVDMLNAMKPFGTEAEQDFIDLIINFLQGSQLYQSYMESMEMPEPEIPRREPEPPLREPEHTFENRTGNTNPQGNRRNDFFRLPIDQLKNILPPDQQSRLETAQMLMQTFQQFS